MNMYLYCRPVLALGEEIEGDSRAFSRGGDCWLGSGCVALKGESARRRRAAILTVRAVSDVRCRVKMTVTIMMGRKMMRKSQAPLDRYYFASDRS